MGACGCPRVCSSVPATTARYSLALHDALPIFDNRPAFRLVLVALRDLVVGHDFAALLAAFVVADWAIVLAVQLVKLNFLAGFNGVINADRNRNQQKSNVTLPDRSHIGALLPRNYAGDQCLSKGLISHRWHRATGQEAACWRAFRMADAVCQRCAGSFASARSIISQTTDGKCGARCLSGTAGCSKIARIVSLTFALLVRLSASEPDSKLYAVIPTA